LLLAPLLSSQEPSAPTAAFEAATIKPSNPEESNHLSKFYPGGRFVATAVSLKNLVLIAYRLQDFQLAGGPKWCESEMYDVNAKPATSISNAETRLMLQNLLKERFKLELHRESRQMPVFELVVGGKGPHLQASPPDAPSRDFKVQTGHLEGRGRTVQQFADVLVLLLGRSVIDKTAVTGRFDWTLDWTDPPPEASTPRASAPPADPAPSLEPQKPDLKEAIAQQFGLKLESRRGPVEVLVIDHAEMPAGN
jgi:uncharacterized protein (TIGR03435 family)